MLNSPVEVIIPRLAVPTIISMLITSIYNMADTFFVSQLGTSASGAVGIIYSAMALIQAFAFMIGMG
ncbi:MAG: MATE family efflux transporter, partial [Lachnospiraceae bacterium]|nr:MATE family efflux transporter [Lachnospiraceae bacterium]